ncbi:MAG: extracellular solute-binding protein, partial [Peptococcales bacterium]
PSATGEPAGKDSDATAQPEAPIEFTMTYADNPTFPFNQDWLVVKEAQKFLNAKITFEVIPYNDYQDKITLLLNSGSAPDVVSYIAPSGPPYSTFALNGALVPVNKYQDHTPNFLAQVEKYNLQEEVKKLYLIDGNLYFLPSLYSAAFYDGGPIIRADLLEKYGLETPTTYDELYDVMKVFKKHEPSSYPLTSLVAARVLYRFTMPSFGISLGMNSSSSSYVLSYDYDKKEYFAGAISDKFKEYLRYMSKLHAEGLLDPEFVNNPNDQWVAKMTTGKSSVTWAYYDQIGGIETNSTIEGLKLIMLPPLRGPAGAYTQPKSITGVGMAFPTTTTKRKDFERLVETVDKMCFSPEMARLFGQGVEGVTFDIVDGKIKYKDEFVNSPDGLYKSLQIKCGIGTDQLQLVWDLPTELLKYDENYAAINKIVADMKGIQTLPPRPKFDADETEQQGLLQQPLADMFEVWTTAFISGTKSIEKDWDTYVAEAKAKGIDEYLKLYNDVLKKSY